MTPFRKRLAELQAWRRSSLAAPSLRSPLLTPRDLFAPPISQVWLSAVERMPTLTNEDYLLLAGTEVTFMVEEVSRRRSLLVSRAPVIDEPMEGRIVYCSAPTDSIPDGASAHESANFFDERDLPPWDLWIGYGRDPADRRWKLVSWVPADCVNRAEAGIRVNAYSCLEWGADDAPWCVA